MSYTPLYPMKNLLLSGLLLLAAPAVFAQKSAPSAETEAVKKTINTFFEGMRAVVSGSAVSPVKKGS